MLAGLLVRLLGADPDQLLEDVAHLDVVDPIGGEVDARKGLDDLIEQVLLVHAGDLLVEREPLHDLADIGRECLDVGAQIGGDVVRSIQQPREIQLRQVVERAAGDPFEDPANHALGAASQRGLLLENRRLRLSQKAIEPAQHRQGQDDLAVFVPLIGAAEQVADAPDEIREL